MRRFYFEAFLISLAVILLEVCYTRIFSYKLVYYFTYLVIGVSLLGLGAGGVMLVTFERLRRLPPQRLILWCTLLAGASVGAGYFLVALVPLNLFSMVVDLWQGKVGLPAFEAAKLALVLFTLFVPFLAAGTALATIFSSQTEDIGKLYFSDLIGAALGCAIVIPAITWVTPPGTVFLSGLAFTLASVPLARDAGRSWSTTAMALAAVFVVAVLGAGRLPDPVRDDVKGAEPISSVFSRWSPVFRVDVVPAPGVEPPTNFLVHDGTLGSVMLKYDGDRSSLGRYDATDRAYPFRVLSPGPNVAIIGSAGGNEILASLHFGARHVTGIELNPVTVSLLTDHFADFSGRLTELDEVTIVNAEGRSFLKSSGEVFDLIWLVAPDSYAAMNAATSGAFVLSESYLYTREMIEETLEHLSPGGILCAQFGEIDYDVKPNRVVRYLGTARAAFQELGIPDFARHVLVAVSPGFGRLETATVLIKRSPFIAAEVERFLATANGLAGARVSYAGPEGRSTSPISRVIADDEGGLADFYEQYPYQVEPISDDSPFFWHFVGFDQALLGGSGLQGFNVEEGIGERILVVFLVFAVVFAAIFLLAPLALLRDVWRTIPYKARVGTYFASIGLGFLFIEICLIQRLTLFLGYPTYSLTVTLFALLISTGVGSLLSERWASARNRALSVLLGAVAVLVGFYELGLDALLQQGVGWPLAVRIAVTIALLAPLGLCLGAFLPLGLGTVSALTPHREAYVAWCWAVNGFTSVVASVLSSILSMSIGFDALMLVGLAIYAIGIAAFVRVPSPAAA